MSQNNREFMKGTLLRDISAVVPCFAMILNREST